jgi:hypothetical protein
MKNKDKHDQKHEMKIKNRKAEESSEEENSSGSSSRRTNSREITMKRNA